MGLVFRGRYWHDREDERMKWEGEVRGQDGDGGWESGYLLESGDDRLWMGDERSIHGKVVRSGGWGRNQRMWKGGRVLGSEVDIVI